MNFTNKNKKLGECTPTSCPKIGIKIHETNNNYKENPFASNNNSISYNIRERSLGINNKSILKAPVTTSLSNLDLDLDHYSLQDLYKLFNIGDTSLTDDSLRSAKKIVLQMHPDKSQLDSKYFLFFSKAYKRLFSIYEFQNKSLKKKFTDEDFFDDSNRNVLDSMFERNKEFKDPKNFNKWFNDSFEKHRLENPIEQGYGDWLKSDEGIMNIDENVTKSNMNEIFEQKKKQIQALSVYHGVTDSFSSSLGGSLLGGDSSFTSDNYTDLRQAYTETLIPVTQEDYNMIPKYNNVNDYKAHRDRANTTPLTKEESERYLLQQKNNLDQQSAALAFKYAQETEKAKQKQQGFWADIKLLTGM
jgi:hypothetical protein